MVDPIAIGFVLGGAVLLLFGAALSIYGVGLLGVIVGGGVGYMIAPKIAGVVGVEGPASLAVGIGVGALIGLIAVYLVLAMAIVALSFTVGTYLGIVAIGPALGEGTIMAVIIGLGVGIAAALLGLFLKRTAMILITSFLGAALASRAVTMADLETASSEFTLDPIVFEPVAPLFAGLFVLGILSQFGLFKLGYVAKIVTWLPGAVILSDSDEEESSTAEA